MKFTIQGLEVYFPYDYIYPEQHVYMCHLKQSLDVKGHCLLEMPTGTGKTVALLSLITSYQMARSDVGKLVYCTRTVPEMEKVLRELKKVVKNRESYFAEGTAPPLLAIGMSSRSNLCVHPHVAGEGGRDVVDARCRQRTAPWIREEREGKGLPDIPDIEDLDGCLFYEKLDKAEAGYGIDIPNGVYTLNDLKEFGRGKGWCPYFAARHVIAYANVVVFNYQYMIDPKVAQTVAHLLDNNCVVVFDEAHNIDNNAIEALSIYLQRRTLYAARENIKSLNKKLKECKGRVAENLRKEHARLVEGIVLRGVVDQEQAHTLANPLPSSDLPKAFSHSCLAYNRVCAFQEAVPGGIRKAEHFLSFLRRFLVYVASRLENVRDVQQEGIQLFLQHVPPEDNLTKRNLKFCHDRLFSLLNTLQIENTDHYLPVRVLSDLGTLLGTYTEGFQIIIEPYDERTPHIPDPIFHFACLDASIALAPVFEKFYSVVITSGTLSPIDYFPRILNFHPVIAKSLNMTLTRECFCPAFVRCGTDGTPIGTGIKIRYQESVVHEYGTLILELCKMIPDGIVCFFVSYDYMQRVMVQWEQMGLLQKISRHKLPFYETQNMMETTDALANYRKACTCGRGAIFFSIARGKVAEGIDFERHFGRCVVMIGIPYQYTLSKVLLSRMAYLKAKFNVSDREFLDFDAMRQVSQCVGRVIRDKGDFGMMIFADKRYKPDKRDKLPGWVREHVREAHVNLSTEMVLTVVDHFNCRMAENFMRRKELRQQELGRSLYSEQQVQQLDQNTDQMTV